jgi:dUTP pyrophosphatase
MMQVRVKKLVPEAVVPKYAKVGDAGLDLTATSYEHKNGRHIYGTGLAVEIPDGYVGLIFPRSSICKQDLRLSNCVGVIDAGYRGEIKFLFENDNMQMRGSREVIRAHWDGKQEVVGPVPVREHQIYKVGDRIGQLIIMPFPQVELVESDELSSTDRGEGGFGSSGR